MGRHVRITDRVKKQYDEIVSDFGEFKYWKTDYCYKGWHDDKYQKRCWGAYYFALKWKGRCGYNIHKLQLVVVRSGDAECAFMFARDIPKSKVKRLQKVVINSDDPEIMRKFARDINRADKQLLENAAIIVETMAL